MGNSQIKLVAADLDGTLLNDDKRIGDETAAAIRDLAPRGIPFVIASARPPRSVRHIYQQLGLDTLQINYNGALIWDEPRRLAIDHRPLAGDLVLAMIRFARAIDPRVLVTCEILDRWHTDRLDNSYTTATGKLFQPDEIAPVETFCNRPITKLLLLGPPESMSTIRIRILDRFSSQINLVSTEPELLQIMEKDVSKASALRRLASRYGVSLENILAIGDGENDMEMLDECGVGVAVANAAQSLKSIADWITPSPNSHGVLEAIRRFAA